MPEAGPRWSHGPVIVFGNLYSKSNRRSFGKKKVFTKLGQARVVPFSRKSDEALAFVDSFMAQVRRPKTAYTGWVALVVVVFYDSMRPDLDVELLKDCIQKVGIIKNDRQIVRQFMWRHVSKKKPRVVFKLKATAAPRIEP